MFIGLFVGGVLVLIVSMALLENYFSAKLDGQKKCFAFQDHEHFDNIQKHLYSEKIFYSTNLSSQTQQAYNSVGMADRAPMELWVLDKDEMKALECVQKHYSVQKGPHAYLVSGKN